MTTDLFLNLKCLFKYLLKDACFIWLESQSIDGLTDDAITFALYN